MCKLILVFASRLCFARYLGSVSFREITELYALIFPRVATLMSNTT